MAKEIQESQRKKRHDLFIKEFRNQKKIFSEFPWIKEKRSISLLNNLEEYIEMQVSETPNLKKEQVSEFKIPKITKRKKN